MAIKVIKEVTKKDLEDWIYEINLEDPNLYRELNNDNKIGIFQINGSTADRLCKEMKPNNFAELNALNAMARPGPLESSAPFYVERKNTKKSPYPQKVNDILKETHYTLVYQEQIMKIFHEIGGFTLEEANEIRGLMKKLSKKEKPPEVLKEWNKQVKRFAASAQKNNISKDDAVKLANDLQAFSSYSFCKAHSTSYSYIAAITLYLSYYFRTEYYSSILTYEADREKYLFQRMNSVKNQGIEILPPSINRSKMHFFPIDKNAIIFGLNDIKFIGSKACEVILKEQPFKSLFDFLIRTRERTVTIRVIEALVSVGAFDTFDKNRKKLLLIVKRFWEEKKSIKVVEKLEVLYNKIEFEISALPGINTTETDLVEYEKQYYGFKFFTTMFAKDKINLFKEMRKRGLIYYAFDEVGKIPKKAPIVINRMRAIKDRNDNDMAFIEIEDINGNTISIPIFYSYYKYIGNMLHENSVYLMNVYKSDDDKIMFGKDSWINSEFAAKRLIKPI